MNMNVDKCIKYLLIWAGLFLPTQAMFVFVFHLPNSVQMIYPFVVTGLLLACCLPFKVILSYLDKKFIIFYLFLLLALFLSVIINYDDIISRGVAFSYYTRTSPGFWDMPDMRLLNWGIIRPFIFFIYIILLFIFLNRGDNVKILLKTLIILAVISCTYSVYQIIAAQFDLPFASIFSGQSGKTIHIWGKLIRTEGIFYEAGPHATILSPIFCILFSQLLEKDDNKLLFKRRTNKIFLCLVSFIMIFTFSPIAFLTPIIAIPLFKALNYNTLKIRITKKLVTILITSCFLLIPLLIGFGTYIKGKTEGEFALLAYMAKKILVSTSSMEDPLVYTNPDARSVRNYAGIQMFKEHKLFGVGPSAAITYYFQYVPFSSKNELLAIEGVINTHIKMLCENGIVGFIPYLLIILYPIFLYIKNYRTLKYKDKLLIDALFIAYILYLLLSYQATLEFFKAYFWMIYVLLVIKLTKRNIYENYYC